MDEIFAVFLNYMFRSATAHIYSFPNFCLEAIFTLVLCVIYVCLHMEITNIGMKTLTLKPNTLHLDGGTKLRCADSTCTSITCVQKQFYRIRSSKLPKSNISYSHLTGNSNHQFNLLPKEIGDASNVQVSRQNLCERIDNILNLTPEQFVKFDQIRKSREDDMVYCLKSLSTLYADKVENKYSEKTVQRHIQLAKEHLQQANISSETCRYLGRNTEALTKSLFDMLEGIVLSSSVQNPLPFKGDIPTLAFDAGHLTTKISNTCLQTPGEVQENKKKEI